MKPVLTYVSLFSGHDGRQNPNHTQPDMKTQPEQQTIPGLPKPDRRKEYRNLIEFHRSEAQDAKKDMKNAALDLAELAAGSLARMANAPEPVQKLAEQFVEARKRFFDQTEAAGLAVDKLRDEERRIEMEAAQC